MTEKDLINEFMETLAVFDTSKYSRTTEYIKQESKRLIQAVHDQDKNNKQMSDRELSLIKSVIKSGLCNRYLGEDIIDYRIRVKEIVKLFTR